MTRREISLSEEEAWRIYELLEELNDFLHQPEKYANQPDISKWLDKKGVYRALSDVFYDVVARWFPVDDDGGVRPPPGVVRRLGDPTRDEPGDPTQEDPVK